MARKGLLPEFFGIAPGRGGSTRARADWLSISGIDFRQ